MKKILLFSLLLNNTNCFAQKLPERKPLQIDVARLQYREAKVNSAILYLAGASFLLASQQKSANGFNGLLLLAGAGCLYQGIHINLEAEEKYFQASKQLKNKQ